MSFKNYSDEQLLCLLRDGSEKALEVILLKYWEPLFITAFKVLNDRPACEDVIQEIFIKIWQNKEKMTVSYSLKAYLFTATRYEVYRQVKSPIMVTKLRLSRFFSLKSTTLITHWSMKSY